MDFGSASGIVVRVAGPFGNGASGGKVTNVFLPAEDWKGAVSPYSQEIAVDGVSVNSRVDLAMDAVLAEAMRNKVMQFLAENDSGTVTVYAFGDKPEEDITLQAILTEVTA